jgi:hypothetical protein
MTTSNRSASAKCWIAAASAPALPRLGFRSYTVAPASVAVATVASLDPSDTTNTLPRGTCVWAVSTVARTPSSSLCAATRTAT